MIGDDTISIKLTVAQALTAPHRVTYVSFRVDQLKVSSVTNAVVQISQPDSPD